VPLKSGFARADDEVVKRLAQAVIAVVGMVAIVVSGPVGSGGVAVAAGATGSQESRLEREVDGLSAGQRAQLEQQLSERLKANGIDLADPQVQARLARALGVSPAEISRAVEGFDTLPASRSGPGLITLLFVAAALVFAPAIFQAIGGTLFEWLAELGAAEGVEPLGR
jgi:phage-related minor tail protein